MDGEIHSMALIVSDAPRLTAEAWETYKGFPSAEGRVALHPLSKPVSPPVAKVYVVTPLGREGAEEVSLVYEYDSRA